MQDCVGLREGFREEVTCELNLGEQVEIYLVHVCVYTAIHTWCSSRTESKCKGRGAGECGEHKA